jgi:hypothetical protein
MLPCSAAPLLCFEALLLCPCFDACAEYLNA